MKLIDEFTRTVASSKSRTVVILVIVLMVIGGIFIISEFNTKSDSLEQAVGKGANIEKFTDGITTTPGVGNSSPDYIKLRNEANVAKAKEAEKTGGSAVPTLTSADIIKSLTPEQAAELAREKAAKAQEEAYNKLLEKRRSDELARLQAQQQLSNSEGTNEQMAAYQGDIAAQAKALLSEWGNIPRQQYKGETSVLAAAGGGQGSNNELSIPGSISENIIYKAGDIIYAVLETAVNSDEPGPVLAKIVSGPLEGSKIIGSAAAAGIYSKQMTLNFNVLSMPSMKKSIPISAIAIDSDTARVALATEVDNHYLLRYGTLLGTTFLEGMSKAVLAGLTNTGVTFEGTTINVGEFKSTSKEQIIAGLGNMGAKIAEKADFSSRPVTIKVASGTGFGLLIKDDLNLNVVQSK